MRLDYAVSLMEKNYEAVGFIPKPRLEKYAENGQLWLQYENSEPCGYLVFGNGWPTLRVYQCCIQVDARRSYNAALLIRGLIEKAQDWHCRSISLWCADDLESNKFWGSMGFRLEATRFKANKRGRSHNGWVYYLNDLFYRPKSPPQQESE